MMKFKLWLVSKILGKTGPYLCEGLNFTGEGCTKSINGFIYIGVHYLPPEHGQTIRLMTKEEFLSDKRLQPGRNVLNRVGLK